MYVVHVEHIKAYNFLNSGLICNPLALLELSYTPLFIQHKCMSNMSDRNVSLYSTVNKTSINNMMPNSKFLNKKILRFNL